MAPTPSRRRPSKTGPREERGRVLGTGVKVLHASLFALSNLMPLICGDCFVCAEGPDLRKFRPKNAKAADAQVRKKLRSGPLHTSDARRGSGHQPSVATPAPRVPAAAAADLPIVFVETVEASANSGLGIARRAPSDAKSACAHMYAVSEYGINGNVCISGDLVFNACDAYQDKLNRQIWQQSVPTRKKVRFTVLDSQHPPCHPRHVDISFLLLCAASAQVT